MKFGHIGVKVLDIEKSISFYTEVLGFSVVKDYQYPDSRLVFLKGNETVIELISKEENEPRSYGPMEHLAFKVEDLEEAMEHLKEHGVDHSAPRVVGSAEIIFFDGPNRERFEFVARKR